MRRTAERAAAPRETPADATARRTGHGVRVAIVDSGVHQWHPHVGGIAGGVGIEETGETTADFVDRLGHGTAVAGAIREKAPAAQLYAVRIFDRSLTTNLRPLVAALQWAVQARMHVVNLSLGTSTPAHEDALQQAVTAAVKAGVLIVAARDGDGIRWLPGSLPGVLSVRADSAVPRDSFHVDEQPGSVVCRASPYPRPIPGVPPERNLHGLSFAVANMTGFVACAIDPRRARHTLPDAVRALTAHRVERVTRPLPRTPDRPPLAADPRADHR